MRFDKDLIICHYETSWRSIILNPSHMTSHQSSFILVMDRLSFEFLRIPKTLTNWKKQESNNEARELFHKNRGKIKITRQNDFCFSRGRLFDHREVSEICSKPTHPIHVWYIYLHLVDVYGKCREIYHTWMVWVIACITTKSLFGRISFVFFQTGNRCKSKRTQSVQTLTLLPACFWHSNIESWPSSHPSKLYPEKKGFT